MAWWEQLFTFEPPEDRWDALGEFSRSDTYVKEGTYCGQLTHPGAATKSFSSYSIGWDLSAYPQDACFCAWLRIDPQSSFGVSDTLKIGFEDRIDGTLLYKQYLRDDLVDEWNFLSFPLSAMTNYSTRSIQNLTAVFVEIYRSSSGIIDFRIDDFYISTDRGKVLDTGTPTYQIRHYERYDTTNLRNQEYVGILEPSSFAYKRVLNQITEATFEFPREVYDSLPEIMDTVRIFRNGMCVWDGVALYSSENFEKNTCRLKCVSSNYVLQRIFDLGNSYFQVAINHDAGAYLAEYVHQADDITGTSGWQQKGFGIPDTHPAGYSLTSMGANYKIPKDEFVYPWDCVASMQDNVEFDFDIRPPFLFNYWEPQKGRTLGIELLQDVHFKATSREKTGHDLSPACRAVSRGGGASYLDDDSDTTAMNTYARLVKLLNTQGKTLSEVQAASAAWVSGHKEPAVIFNAELLPGGWIYPWDLGDTATWVLRETEYDKRIMSLDVSVGPDGENVKVVLQ